MTMAVTLTPKHAAAEWSFQFPKVLEIMNEHIWLKPILEIVAQELFKKSNWGMKARVISGAASSMLDLRY